MSSTFTEEYFFELLSRAIDTCQEIHNDSRTPLDVALLLTPVIRDLTAKKRELRKKQFNIAESDPDYKAATDALNVVVNTVKAKIIEHNKTMDFVTDATKALDAVIKLASLFV
jgi:hypothetical protein